MYMLKPNDKNFNSYVIGWRLLGKLNSLGEGYNNQLNLYQYDHNFQMLAKINDWLMKYKYPYLIQVKLSDQKKGAFAWAIQEPKKDIIYRHADNFTEVIMYSLNRLLQIILKEGKSFIPDEIKIEENNDW